MAGSGSAAEAPKPATADDLAKRYVECWGFYNAKDFDKLKTCFASPTTDELVDGGPPTTASADDLVKAIADAASAVPDRKADLELTLVNGKNVASVQLYTGTDATSKKKFGLQTAYVAHFTDAGKEVDHTWFYIDQGQLAGQLGAVKTPVRPVTDKPWGPNEIVIAKDDDTEKKNLEAVKKTDDAFNKHDTKAMEASLADDLVWSESGVPKDWNKKEAVAAHADLFKGFSDLKIAADTSWAAGDYVVEQGTMTGTNDGAAPSMGIAKKTGKQVSLHYVQMFKLKDGKLSRSWGFWNSKALAQQLGMLPPAGGAKPGDKKDDKKPADKKPADKKPADKKPAKG